MFPSPFGNPGKDGKCPKEKTSLQGFEIGNFSQFVGKLIADNSEKFQFPLFGAIVTVPAAGLTTDKALRYFKACKVAAALLFMEGKRTKFYRLRTKKDMLFWMAWKIRYSLRRKVTVCRYPGN